MTILFSIENGFSARYLLRTGVLDALVKERVPVKVVSLNADEDYFRSPLEARGIKVLPQPPLPPYKGRSLQVKLENVRYAGMPNLPAGSNIDVKHESYLQLKTMRPLFLEGYDWSVRAHRRFRFVRTGLTRVGMLYDVRAYREILDRERVRLLILDGIGATGPHLPGWSRAAAGKCRSMTVITNWDHPTTKGYRANLTDRYLVWGSAMQNELIKHHDVPPSRIQQVGATLFDVYAQPGALMSRDEVCNKFDLAPNRPIVLYLSMSPVNYPHNIDICRFLTAALADLPGRPQLVVRLHPLFLQPSTACELNEHHKLAQQSGVAYSIPEVFSHKLLPDMPLNEIRVSASLVRHADVIVNVFSTMQLDACICDKPVVNLGFDWASGSSGTQVVSRFENYIHLHRIITLGAVQVANSPEHLVASIADGLEHPSARSKERKQLVVQECGLVDGQAKDRIAGAILREYDGPVNKHR